MRQAIGLIILTFFIFSCSGQDKGTNSSNFFNADNFIRDTLYIKSQFMECGEWGGHLELSKVYLSGREFYIDYQKFDTDCNSIKDNNGIPVQKLVKNITKKVLDKDKLLIHHYMHQLLDSKIQESIPFQAGYIFEVTKSDHTLYISVYPGGLAIKNQYLELIQKLLK